MNEPDHDYDYDDANFDGGFCYDCHGGGWKLACPDDLCHGQYEGGAEPPCGSMKCLYPCRTCNPKGEFP